MVPNVYGDLPTLESFATFITLFFTGIVQNSQQNVTVERAFASLFGSANTIPESEYTGFPSHPGCCSYLVSC